MREVMMGLAGAAAVGFAVLMFFQRSLYAAAICFLAVLLQAAVLFYACGARLLAALVVLVYAGAVAVLIVVSIQSSGGAFAAGKTQARFSSLGVPRPLAWAGFAAAWAEAAALLMRGAALGPGPVFGRGDLSLGPALFGPYAVAVEAAGFLILAVSLARSEER
ncbi:MAG: NADH-quinone oxidoreductase subunit J, partial [Elusimicrobia bacterium]|nr:NADH-quinone oxidoreductase subunit J [Elusimicrobiota bacterium]